MIHQTKSPKAILRRVRHGLPLSLVVDAGGAMVRCATGPHSRGEPMAIPGRASYAYRIMPRWMGDPAIRRVEVIDPACQYHRVGTVERRVSDVPTRKPGWRYYPRPMLSVPVARWGEAVWATMWRELAILRQSGRLDETIVSPITAAWFVEPDECAEWGPGGTTEGR